MVGKCSIKLGFALFLGGYAGMLDATCVSYTALDFSLPLYPTYDT